MTNSIVFSSNRWKTDYEVITGWAASAKPWCDLCMSLHENHSTQVHKNLSRWFSKETDCKLPTSYDIGRFTHGEKVDCVLK